jgi:hypothetical protein
VPVDVAAAKEHGIEVVHTNSGNARFELALRKAKMMTA